MKKCLIDIKLLINFYDFQNVCVCVCSSNMWADEYCVYNYKYLERYKRKIRGEELDKQIPHYDAHISAYDA